VWRDDMAKKLIQIGVNYRKKKLNPSLKEYIKSGYKLTWKKRYVDDTALIRSCKLTKTGKYRKSCIRPVKKRLYDVYVSV